MCSVDGCERPVRARGWCATHWSRWKRTGDPGGAEPQRRPAATIPECAVAGCDRSASNGDMCGAHRLRKERHGDVRADVPLRVALPLAEGFWARVDKSSDCWLWTGARGSHGYGDYRDRLAHRFAYEILVGPIPAGLTIDHLCCVRLCVNPSHMETVTRAENTRRQMARRG